MHVIYTVCMEDVISTVNVSGLVGAAVGALHSALHVLGLGVEVTAVRYLFQSASYVASGEVDVQLTTRLYGLLLRWEQGAHVPNKWQILGEKANIGRIRQKGKYWQNKAKINNDKHC